MERSGASEAGDVGPRTVGGAAQTVGRGEVAAERGRGRVPVAAVARGIALAVIPRESSAAEAPARRAAVGDGRIGAHHGTFAPR